MSSAIFCLDGDEEAQARAGKKDLQDYPVLGAAIGSVESYDRGVALCLEMGMPQRPAEEFEAVQTSLPGFEQGTYVEFPYAGHGPSRSVECAGSLLNKFYDNPNSDPDLSCVDEMEEPQIWAPMFITGLAPRLMVLLAEDKKALAIPAAWAGLSVIITLLAFLHLTLLPVGRMIDGRDAVDTSELLLVFGLVPWANFGAWGGLLAGLLGLGTLLATIRARLRMTLPIGTLLGLLITGAAAVSLSAFLLAWELAPF